MTDRGMFVLHAAGGAQIGVGHLSRCRSLAVELLRKQISVVFLIYESQEALAARFNVPGAQTFVAQSRADAMNIREELLREHFAARTVLITDLLNLGAEDADRARSEGFDLLVHVNDSGLPAYSADLVVDGDAFKTEASKEQTRVLCGARYHIVNPAITARRPYEPWDKPSVEKVLLCFGGADPARQTEFFLCELGKRRLSTMFTAVAGPAFSSERWEALQTLAGPRDHLIRASSNMAELILDHDAVVTLGGLTSYEAMCLGRAALAVACSNMAPYVEQLAAIGLLKNLGSGLRAVEELCASLADVESIRQLARAGWEAIDGRGAERVAAILAKKVKQ